MTATAIPFPDPQVQALASELTPSTDHATETVTGLVDALALDALRAAAESGGSAAIAPLSGIDAGDGEESPGKRAEGLINQLDSSVTVLDPVDVDGTHVTTIHGRLHAEFDDASLAILRPIVPLIERRHVDAAAMRLRNHDGCIGPTTNASWYFIGVDRSVDLEETPITNDLTSLTGLIRETSLSVATLPMLQGCLSREDFPGVFQQLELAELADSAAGSATRAWMDTADREAIATTLNANASSV